MGCPATFIQSRGLLNSMTYTFVTHFLHLYKHISNVLFSICRNHALHGGFERVILLEVTGGVRFVQIRLENTTNVISICVIP